MVDSHAESIAGSSDLKQTGPKEKSSANTSEDAASNKVAVDNVASASAAIPSRNPAMQGARDRVKLARGAARNLIEEDRFQAVEKLRHISSVVLDEAAYDPSLRFVLVAAVLFVLFLVLLIASELIS